jgi:hypothetical protein
MMYLLKRDVYHTPNIMVVSEEPVKPLNLERLQEDGHKNLSELS